MNIRGFRLNPITGFGEDVRDIGCEHGDWVHRRRDHIEGSGRMADHNQGMTRHKRAEISDLSRQRIRVQDGQRMRIQISYPRVLLAALRCRGGAVPSQDVMRGVSRYGVAEVWQGSMNVVVAPNRVLTRHPEHVAGRHLHSRRIALAAGREDALLRDEPAMPGHEGIRDNQAGDIKEETVA